MGFIGFGVYSFRICILGFIGFEVYKFMELEILESGFVSYRIWFLLVLELWAQRIVYEILGDWRLSNDGDIMYGIEEQCDGE